MIKKFNKYNESLTDIEKFSYQLIDAIIVNRLDLVKKSIENGADINFISYRNGAQYPFTPIIYTAISNANSPEIVEYLVKNGADMEYKVNAGAMWRVLEYAAHNKKLDIIKKLIELGINIDYKPINGLDFINLLRNNMGIRIEYYNVFVSYQYQKDLIEFNNRMYFKLKEHNYLNDNIEKEYKNLQDTEDLGLFYKTNEEISPTYFQDNDIIYAINTNNFNSFKKLVDDMEDIDQVIDQDLRNPEGDCTLIYATYHNRLKMAEYLLENGANVNITDKHKNTPIMSINTSTGVSKIFDMIKLLIEYGADIKMKNELGKNFVEIIHNGNSHFFKSYQKSILDIIYPDDIESFVLMLYNAGIEIDDDIKEEYKEILSASDLGLMYNERIYLGKINLKNMAKYMTVCHYLMTNMIRI